MLNNNSNGYSVRWSNSTVRKCLKLYFTCGSSEYKKLIKQNFFLSSIRTLQQKIAFYKCLPKIHDKIFNLLLKDCLLPEEKKRSFIVR